MSYEFADRLIELRRSRALSQEDLAGKIGVSRQAVSKWERAESAPDIGNLMALSELYEISLDELVRGEETVAAAEASAEGATSAAISFKKNLTVESPDEEAAAEEAPSTEASSTEATTEEAVIVEAFDGEGPAEEAVSAEVPSEPSPTATSEPAPAASTQNTAAPQDAASQGAVPQGATASQDTVVQNGTVPQAAAAPVFRTSPAWRMFPYPLLCVVLFLFCGFFLGMWHPAWVIFLTIPFYYWVVNIIMHDPNYMAAHASQQAACVSQQVPPVQQTPLQQAPPPQTPLVQQTPPQQTPSVQQAPTNEVNHD